LSDYFNTDEYVHYLRKNYGVSGCDFEERCGHFAGPDAKILLDYLTLMEIKPEHKVLEVGCGLGRVLKEIHDKFGARPYGVDISKRTVDEAAARVGRLCSELKVSAAEKLHYPDHDFDRVMLWGVFDLTDQSLSLTEMTRVTKPGGLVLVTGKNDNYHDDDSEAYEAENAARHKGIPNHFTDFGAMLAFSEELGLKPTATRYFERRGDFAKDLFRVDRPDRFYEYLVMFREVRVVEPTRIIPRRISSSFSKTCLAKTAGATLSTR
jgi:ubiquinone/menaquinone biosynthesis C-methylase UbiE